MPCLQDNRFQFVWLLAYGHLCTIFCLKPDCTTVGKPGTTWCSWVAEGMVLSSLEILECWAVSIDLSPAPSAVMLLECCAFCNNFWPTCRVVLAMSAPLQGNCELTLEEQVLVDGFRFSVLPSGGKDTWEIVGNFLIRKHAKARKDAFHPLHRSTPVEPYQLTDQRLTILFKSSNSTWDRSLYKDVWRAGRQPSIAFWILAGIHDLHKVAAGGFHCKKLTRAFQWWWALVELASHDKRAQTTSQEGKQHPLGG